VCLLNTSVIRLSNCLKLTRLTALRKVRIQFRLLVGAANVGGGTSVQLLRSLVVMQCFGASATAEKAVEEK
jgi:hypothetical protein